MTTYHAFSYTGKHVGTFTSNQDLSPGMATAKGKDYYGNIVSIVMVELLHVTDNHYPTIEA